MDLQLWYNEIEYPLPNSRDWDVIWRDLFAQIELGVDIASLGIKQHENHRVPIFRPP